MIKYIVALFSVIGVCNAQSHFVNGILQNYKFNFGVSSNPVVAGTPYIVSGNAYATRSDSYWAGFTFTPTNNLSVTSLGRVVESGNTLTHKIKILTVAPKTLICSNIVATTGSVGTTNWTTISPITLNSGTEYVILIDEGTDNWANGHSITAGPVGIVGKSAYAYDDPEANPVFDDTTGQSFSTPNFLYAN